MRVLVTGANGQLAKDLVRVCELAGDATVGLDRGQLDIADVSAVRETITTVRPDVIFNCAAWTAVDACEGDPQKASLINGHAVGFVAEAASAVGAHLVQVSTDYVFDGLKTSPYLEDDLTNPQSAYGRSKLLGESEALAVGGAVVRTSWVCSAHGGNMVATILRLAREHRVLRFVADQRGFPTFTADLAPALRQIGIDRVANTLHVTNDGDVSWFEFAQAVLCAVGEDPSRVEPINTADLQPERPAQRPANSMLANRRYVELGYVAPRDFREALAEIVHHYWP